MEKESQRVLVLTCESTLLFLLLKWVQLSNKMAAMLAIFEIEFSQNSVRHNYRPTKVRNYRVVP